MGSFSTIHSDVVHVCSLARDGLLLSQTSGHSVCLAIREGLRQIPRGGVLLVDFSDVEFASHALLKEILLTARTDEERYSLFRVEIGNRDLIESLEMIARQMDWLVPAINTSGSWHVFGKPSPADRLTLEIVMAHEEMTASQLKQMLSISLSAASNRLKRLASRGVLRREERSMGGHGGREFSYKPLVRPATAGPNARITRASDNA